MKKCKALGREWKLVSLDGEQAVIENETGRYSILAKNIEIIKPEKKAAKKKTTKKAKDDK